MKKEILHWQMPDSHISLCGHFVHVAKCTKYKNRITCKICLEKLKKNEK